VERGYILGLKLERKEGKQVHHNVLWSICVEWKHLENIDGWCVGVPRAGARVKGRRPSRGIKDTCHLSNCQDWQNPIAACYKFPQIKKGWKAVLHLHGSGTGNKTF